MPAAYTHTYIAHLILERLAAGVPDGADLRVALPPTDTGAAVVRIPSATVALLLENPASFCMGAAAPDFFADVISGITTSHQPIARTDGTLADYLTTFSKSVTWDNPHQVAWLAGWFCHLCADVFGHHWVGKEAGGNFLSWFTTPPQVVRKHLGIEVEWAKCARKDAAYDYLPTYVQKEFGRTISLEPGTQDPARACLFQRQLVLDAMMTDEAPLWERYYDPAKGTAQERATPQLIHPLTQVRGFRKWHDDQIKQIREVRSVNNSFAGRLFDFDLPRLSQAQLDAIRFDCPLCQAHGTAMAAVQAACPTCAGTGVVERVLLSKCLFCDNSKTARVACATCDGMPDALRDLCPDCHGARELDLPCPFCAGIRELAGFAQSRCEHCKGAKQIREDLDRDCPLCKGQKALEKVLADPEFSSRDLINLICDRLLIYHQARRQRIDRLVDTYQEAHERLALLMLAKDAADGVAAVKECFSSFLSQAGDFVISQLTFSDLVPELAAYSATVRASIEKVSHLFLDLVPQGWVEAVARLKQEIVEKALGTISDYLGNPLLSDAEEAKVIALLGKQRLRGLVWRRRPTMALVRPLRPRIPELVWPGNVVMRPVAHVPGPNVPRQPRPNLPHPPGHDVPHRPGTGVPHPPGHNPPHPIPALVARTVPQLFAPIADAISLFLLAVEGCSPTAQGLRVAFARLGAANNIDAQKQPELLSFYKDESFPWNDRFRLVGRRQPGEEDRLGLSL